VADPDEQSAEQVTPTSDADDATGPDFEGLLLRSGFNYHVFVAAAFGFLRGRGAGPEELVAWMAERLATTWSGLEGHGADAVLNLVLENLASTGYQVRDFNYGANESIATVGAVPLGLDEERWQRLLEPFGVAPSDMHALFRVFVPLARSAGATLDLAGFHDTLRITVRRDTAQGASEHRSHLH
jgi:hypothetical protein